MQRNEGSAYSSAKFRIKRYAVIYGTLHDCATTDDTEKGGVPIKDEDGWIQYAVVLRGFVELKTEIS